MANTTYVLVHGAWMGRWAWNEVVPRLEAAGHRAITLDLPAHGDSMIPATAVSLESYCDAVVDAIGEQQDIILVGHSMGGMVISAVAEAIPRQLKALVYVSAYLPRSGESLFQLSQEDTNSLVGRYWRQDDPANYSPASIAPEGIVAVFGADCPPPYQTMLVERHRPEPVAPLATPTILTDELWGSVPRFYIETLHDQAVSHQLQTLMLGRVSVQQRCVLATSHNPFFASPSELAAVLAGLA